MLEGQLKSLPRKFRTSRIVIAGCGQVGKALLNHFQNRDFTATYRPGANSPPKVANLRLLKAKAIQIDLSEPSNLKRLAGLASKVIWMAAPNGSTAVDHSLQHLALELKKHQAFHNQKASVVYVSTTGVYGDVQGNWVNERSRTNPQSPRAIRRVQTENQLKTAYKKRQINVALVRAPGIYSESRLPIDRLKNGTPALISQEDSYSNHIHELDLARICMFTLFRARPWDVINAVDTQPSKMSEYFDEVAEHFGLPKPPRISREKAQEMVSPMMWSFMKESRRIQSLRLNKLKIKLLYPTVKSFLSTLPQGSNK